MVIVQNLLPWLTHHLMGAVVISYVTGILGVLVYTFLEPRDQR
ncbi:MAG TPA: hypothetical protein VI359_00195 [Nitrospiraceae bacterium]